MTTLEKINIFAELGLSGALENRIIHEYNNGGVKSAYGLSNLYRAIIIKWLFAVNPKCYCVECI